MTRLLVETCEVVATMDEPGTEIAGGSVLIEDGMIVWVGAGAPPSPPDERLDGAGTVAIPGLINTHHHLFQTLTRARAQDKILFDWLVELYPVWAGLDEEWVRTSTLVGLAELALSGCTTTTDHHYLFPRGRSGVLEASVAAAAEIGLRFHPTRGSMDLGTSRGGLPPDEVCQEIDEILAETEDAIDRLHDPSPGSMVRVGVAPCSPFSVSEELMRESAELARRRGVRLHTHLAETLEEEAFCRERFALRPTELMEEWGWLGSDVWLAHCVHLNEKDARRIAESGSGVAWCPSSNLRLGAGFAPARALLDAGGVVGLGVDGSASNDAGNLGAEIRQALLITRGVSGASSMSAREALQVATTGGASCLGRDDLGSIEQGKRADLALFPVDDVATAGSDADLVASVVLCEPRRVRHLIVEGRVIVRDAELRTADEHEIAAQGHRAARRIAEATS